MKDRMLMIGRRIDWDTWKSVFENWDIYANLKSYEGLRVEISLCFENELLPIFIAIITYNTI